MLKKLSTAVSALLAALFFEAIFSQSALAYLDPGTGSFIVQIIIAGFMGFAFFIKTSWGRIKMLLTKIFSKKKDQNNQDNQSNV